MNCPDCIDRLHELMDRRRVPDDDSFCAEHLDICAACATEARLLLETERILAAEPKIFPPADLKTRIMDRLSEAPRPREAPRVEWLRVAAALLLCALGLYGVGLSAGFGAERLFDPSLYMTVAETLRSAVSEELTVRAGDLETAVRAWPSALPSDPGSLLPDFLSTQAALLALCVLGTAALGLNTLATSRAGMRPPPSRRNRP
ncbi:MAG: hypothetical protein HYY93_13150 [Planctomycetes bacterium]|nr:hypothetical protein [Planctomycetota bacterium]